MCSSRGCKPRDSQNEDTRVGECDVNVGEECREKTGGAYVGMTGSAGLSARFPIWRHTAATNEIEAAPAPPGSVISAEDPPAISIRMFTTDAVMDHRGQESGPVQKASKKAAQRDEQGA